MVAMLATVSCGGPDRSGAADDLERQIAQMPGVGTAYVVHTDDFTSGSVLGVSVDMIGADVEQVVDVAARIESIVGDDFDGYRRSATFRVAVGGDVDVVGVLDPAEVGDHTRIVREILTRQPGTSITWTDRDSGQQVRTRGADSAVVFEALRHRPDAREPVTAVIVGEPRWSVVFPFEIDDEAAIRATVAGSPLPVEGLDITGGHVSALWVRVDDVTTAARDLPAVIDLFAAGAEHPILVRWDGPRPAERDAPFFGGTVHVGGCDYPDNLGESDPERFHTADALELRAELRARYDTCP